MMVPHVALELVVNVEVLKEAQISDFVAALALKTDLAPFTVLLVICHKN